MKMSKIPDCCNASRKAKKCKRKSDNKVFVLPRRFTRKKCKNPKGFSMKSSCAPYKNCKSISRKLNRKKRKTQK